MTEAAREDMMPDFPPGVIDAVAQVIHDRIYMNNSHHVCRDDAEHEYTMRQARGEAEAVLTVAEEVWPHGPPSRDLASTIATRADLRLPPEARRPDWPPPRVPKYRTTVEGGIGFLGDPRRDVIT